MTVVEIVFPCGTLRVTEAAFYQMVAREDLVAEDPPAYRMYDGRRVLVVRKEVQFHPGDLIILDDLSFNLMTEYAK